jgi:hypothetical protein
VQQHLVGGEGSSAGEGDGQGAEGEEADEGLTGKLDFPGVAILGYGIPYPQSRTEARFPIPSDGTTVTDFAKRDVSGQFSDNKSWTLIVPPDVLRRP